MPSPKTSGEWFCCVSAPTSPSRASEFYREFDEFSGSNQTDDDFAFHVSKEAEKSTVSAAELFDGGRIRSLKPPANDPYGGCWHGGGGNGGEIEATTSIRSPLLSSFGSPKSPKFKEDVNWSKGRKTFWSGFTPKKRNKEPNPYALLLDDDRGRGRERPPSLSTSASRTRGTRSLSPIRAPSYKYPPWEDEEEEEEEDDDDQKKKEPKSPTPSSSTSLTVVVQAPSISSRMRRLKNFLLFRSASEGRTSDKDPMKKVAAFYKRQNEAEKGGKTAKIRGPVSPHERHYAMSKAASEDMKKKTFLPYRRGILLGR